MCIYCLTMSMERAIMLFMTWQSKHTKVSKQGMVDIIHKAFKVACMRQDEKNAKLFSWYISEFKITNANNIPENLDANRLKTRFNKAYNYLLTWDRLD